MKGVVHKSMLHLQGTSGKHVCNQVLDDQVVVLHGLVSTCCSCPIKNSKCVILKKPMYYGLTTRTISDVLALANLLDVLDENKDFFGCSITKEQKARS